MTQLLVAPPFLESVEVVLYPGFNLDTPRRQVSNSIPPVPDEPVVEIPEVDPELSRRATDYEPFAFKAKLYVKRAPEREAPRGLDLSKETEGSLDSRPKLVWHRIRFTEPAILIQPYREIFCPSTWVRRDKIGARLLSTSTRVRPAVGADVGGFTGKQPGILRASLNELHLSPFREDGAGSCPAQFVRCFTLLIESQRNSVV